MVTGMSDNKKLSAIDVLAEYQELPEFCTHPLTQVNQRSSFGDMPIHVACTRGRVDEVEALLVAGADVNAQGELENTPLHAAAGQGNVAVIKALLQWGALLRAVNSEGKTARDIALALSHDDVVAVIDTWVPSRHS